MNKPKSLAALKRYLTENPYLRMEHPGLPFSHDMGAKTEGRKFLRIQAGQPVYQVPNGSETFGEKTAKYYEFYEDHFAVKFPEDWKDMEGKPIKYYYLDSPYVESA